MNQNWKQVFRKMNLDADVRTMQPGDYRMLTNGSPIQPYSSSYANAVQDVVCSLLGNDLVSNSLPSGTNQVIGFLQDRKSNRAFYCVWNNTAANNSIYQYKDGVITLVMRTSLFAWAQTDFVDMDIVGDILIFTNNRSDIKKINVAKALAGGVYTPAIEEITLIKQPPLVPLTFTLSYDNSVETNFIYGNYFQFFHRYVYEDYDYSVFGPSSQVSDGWTAPTGTGVQVVADSNIALAGVQTIDGYSTSGGVIRVLVVGQTNPVENGIYTPGAGAWTRVADFAAAGSRDTTVLVQIGFNYHSTVWRVKGTNVGTTNTTATQLQGPNKMTISRSGTPPATVIQIEYAVRVNGSNEFTVYKIEKAGSFSSSHTFYNSSYLFTVPDADTFVWSDNIPIYSKALKLFKSRLFLFNNTEGYTHSTTTTVGLTATTTSFSVGGIGAVDKIQRSAKAGVRYGVGIVFFDTNRRSSGVKCDNTVLTPENNSCKIVVDTSGLGADVPSWATHFSVVVTKPMNESFFIEGLTQDVYYYKKDASGTYTYSKTLSAFSSQGTVIDIGSLLKEGKGYTFNAGDRIKIYNPSGSLPPTVIDVEILAQDGRFLLTRTLLELTLSTTATSNYRFDIYTPKNPTQEPFYEVGLTYPIASLLGVGSFDFLGDISVVAVNIYNDTTGYDNTNPFNNEYVASALGPNPVFTMNGWGKSTWVTQGGRSMVKSDSRQINKYSYIRFGQEYIQNSNFLGINTFYALDEQALPIENGAGVRLAEAGEVLVAVHEIETEAVYVGQGFVKTDNGQNQFLTKTDNVIGDVRRYQGGYGSVNPASVVSREGKVYFVDRRNGCIVRRSQDGLTAISDYGVRGLMSTLCGIHDVLATSRIIAGWDPQYDCYCVSFIDTSGPSGYTYYFNEERNSWVFRSTMLPEFWGLLNQDQFAFKSGAMWAQTIEGNYNKFFGVQYNRSLDIEFSPLRSLIHLWDAIEVDVENIYLTSGSNEDIVLLYHKNGDTLQTKINYADFRLRESDRVWRSAFFRWINDPNFSAPDAITKSKYGSVKRIRGQSAFVNIAYNGTDRNPMKSITIFYTPSMQSTP